MLFTARAFARADAAHLYSASQALMVVWRRWGKERAVWKWMSIGTAEVLVVVAMLLVDGDEREKLEMSDESR